MSVEIQVALIAARPGPTSAKMHRVVPVNFMMNRAGVVREAFLEAAPVQVSDRIHIVTVQLEVADGAVGWVSGGEREGGDMVSDMMETE